MSKENSKIVDAQVALPIERIQSLIHSVRGEKVILDSDLAGLYGVETKMLKRQVRRNITRFPSDFMMELTREEYNSLRCQNGTIENGRGEHTKYLPFAFTENGVSMLSSVLNSEIAIQVNIQIMRAFTVMRSMMYALSQTSLKQERLELEVAKLTNRVEEILHDQNDINDELSEQIEVINMSIDELNLQVESMIQQPTNSKPNPVGYQATEQRNKEAK